MKLRSLAIPNILILDPVCPAPYDPQIVATQGVGGTEATVVRVAEELARDLGSSVGGKVVVLQRGRKSMAKHNAIYAPLTRQWEGKRWDAVIVLRSPALLPAVKEQCPSALLVWWLHDLADKRLGHPAIVDTQPFIVTASNFHRQHATDGIKRLTPRYFPQVVRIYNPIDDDLCRDNTPIDRNKLIFFSSPHKGLEWTLKVFADALRANPAFRLFVANPGYFASQVPKESLAAIHDLGSLPHKEVIRHVREALCVFYLCFGGGRVADVWRTELCKIGALRGGNRSPIKQTWHLRKLRRRTDTRLRCLCVR